MRVIILRCQKDFNKVKEVTGLTKWAANEVAKGRRIWKEEKPEIGTLTLEEQCFALRHRDGYTLKDLSQFSGLSTSCLSRMERGVLDPRGLFLWWSRDLARRNR